MHYSSYIYISCYCSCNHSCSAQFIFLCHRSEYRRAPQLRESPTVMQPNSSEQGDHAGNGLSLTLQTELLTRTPVPGAAAANPDVSEVRVNMSGAPGDSSGGASSRRSRVNSHSHSHSHSHGHSRPQHHSNSEPELDPPDSDLDSGEPSASLSELRCLFRWLQKSLPFLIILCAKLVIQHALGEGKLSKQHYCITVKTKQLKNSNSFFIYQV